RAAKELTREVQGRTPLLPAGPPDRHQDRLRPRPRPRPAAAPDLVQDDAEADRQLGPPFGGVQPRLTQEREKVAAVSPQMVGQALVGRVRLRGRGPPGPTNVPRCGTSPGFHGGPSGRSTAWKVSRVGRSAAVRNGYAPGPPLSCFPVQPLASSSFQPA